MCQKTWGGELLLQVLTLDSSCFSEAHSTQWDEIYFKGSSLVAENLALIALLWICFVWWNVIQFCFPGGILISIGFNDIMNSRRVRVHWLDGNGWQRLASQFLPYAASGLAGWPLWATSNIVILYHHLKSLYTIQWYLFPSQLYNDNLNKRSFEEWKPIMVLLCTNKTQKNCHPVIGSPKVFTNVFWNTF